MLSRLSDSLKHYLGQSEPCSVQGNLACRNSLSLCKPPIVNPAHCSEAQSLVCKWHADLIPGQVVLSSRWCSSCLLKGEEANALMSDLESDMTLCITVDASSVRYPQQKSTLFRTKIITSFTFRFCVCLFLKRGWNCTMHLSFCFACCSLHRHRHATAAWTVWR